MTGSAVSVTQVNKKNSRKPLGKKRCPAQQPDTCNIPSFSEFCNYSLVIEDDIGDDGSSRVNGGKKEANIDPTEKLCASWNTEPLSHATDELHDLSCQHQSGRYSGQSASSQQCHNTSSFHEKLLASWNIESLTQATNELCELGSRHQSGRYSGQSASSQQCHDTSAVYDGLKTSTPHPLSTLKMSNMVCNELVESTSQLQLFDASNDSVFGMFQCLFRLFYRRFYVAQGSIGTVVK